MGKNRVPEWLNSSLWSSSPSPDDDRLLRYNSKPSTTVAKTPVEPKIPEPPPKIVEEEHAKPETRDSRSDDDSSSSFSAEDISRQAQVLSELSRKVINMRELRKLASQGIPDGAGIRPTVWKLLLGYLPCDRGLWSSELAKKRSQYKHFKEELLVNPQNFEFLNISVASQSEITSKLDKSACLEKDKPTCEGSGLLSRLEITHGEHPLSLGKTSVWNQFFQDTEIIEQIDRDVKRTHPDMHFFSGDSPFPKSNQEALRSILIIFAKLNPGIRYVQGMNEVLAPLFYVFRNDPDEENAASAEADTFFCFVELLSGFRDNFCQQLDNSIVGIRSTITKLSQLLKEHDEELWRHLEVTTKVHACLALLIFWKLDYGSSTSLGHWRRLIVSLLRTFILEEEDGIEKNTFKLTDRGRAISVEARLEMGVLPWLLQFIAECILDPSEGYKMAKLKCNSGTYLVEKFSNRNLISALKLAPTIPSLSLIFNSVHINLSLPHCGNQLRAKALRMLGKLDVTWRWCDGSVLKHSYRDIVDTRSFYIVAFNVNPQFYAFRWITLLLTQEFNFADSLHIWDTLLSDPEGPQEKLVGFGEDRNPIFPYMYSLGGYPASDLLRNADSHPEASTGG
ncbi:hypothetical protein HHK36_013064 [Tetracentron sinense]|uniref:Rab-GAP TBC domain-containing protein n=1 Tax=Tetracentron sinense TaxID=13715 RepID=A0A834ZGF0_TETSI|nr:hypothetical protein HHK36_013064 [Tetracentron sinense]